MFRRAMYACLAAHLLLMRSLSIDAEAAVPTSLPDCLSFAKVPVSLPYSTIFSQLSQPYNTRLQYIPAVIVLPTAPQHVSSAVVCAAKFQTKVQPRSGGHS